MSENITMSSNLIFAFVAVEVSHLYLRGPWTTCDQVLGTVDGRAPRGEDDFYMDGDQTSRGEDDFRRDGFMVSSFN